MPGPYWILRSSICYISTGHRAARYLGEEASPTRLMRDITHRAHARHHPQDSCETSHIGLTPAITHKTHARHHAYDSCETSRIRLM
eukprot:3873837-Rhodomonas_salina.1